MSASARGVVMGREVWHSVPVGATMRGTGRDGGAGLSALAAVVVGDRRHADPDPQTVARVVVQA